MENNDNVLNQQIREKFESTYQEGVARNKRPVILVCGETGAGKSSLIQAVLGDVVPADAIGTGVPQTQDFDRYESNANSIGQVVVYDSKGFEQGESIIEMTSRIKAFIDERAKDEDPDHHIHLVWYVINAGKGRSQPQELELAKSLSPNYVLVVTKSDCLLPEDREALCKACIENGVREDRIVFTAGRKVLSESMRCFGCEKLVDLSYEILPVAYREAFIGAQVADVNRSVEMIKAKSGKAKAIVGTAAAAATGIAIVPIPVADAPLLTTTQVGMIGSLAALYGVNGKELGALVAPLLARVAGTYLASSLIKLIPGLGSVINGGVAALLTTAMGYLVCQQFEKAAIAKVTGLPVEYKFDWESLKQIYDSLKRNEKSEEA